MRNFDHDYVELVLRRIQRIDSEATPAWGTLDRAKMIRHLAEMVRYSMGLAGDLPDVSTWFTRRIVAPLLMRGILSIPKNVKGPAEPDSAQLTEVFEPNPDKYLLRVLEEYLSHVQADEVNPKSHPLFGPIGIDGWAKMHMLHFEHHLRQFGV